MTITLTDRHLNRPILVNWDSVTHAVPVSPVGSIKDNPEPTVCSCLYLANGHTLYVTEDLTTIEYALQGLVLIP